MRDLERALVDTEDFLMRQLGSRTAREASGRKLKRGAAEFFRRMRRAGLIFVALLFLLIALSAFGSAGFFTWLVALPAIMLAAMLSMTFPTWAGRAPRAPTRRDVARIPLPTLAERCDRWLLDRCDELPRAALPAADLIVERLRRLAPGLADIPDGSPLQDEVRRLVGGHLPRLVDSYIALPPEARGPRSENSLRLTESLGAVAEELTRLCGEVDGCRETSFAIEHRFIESRYRDDLSLRGR
ncbi:MAG: hypothetical protein QOI38_2976 [Sphingomonadales bacterium]|jgi:hypothetical protein|nr:hypothetical protein [Sphingomonadales bacterium]